MATEIDWTGFLADERMGLLAKVAGLADWAKRGITPDNASEAERAEILALLHQGNDLVTQLLAYYSTGDKS